jgi:hypothetical protein
LTTIEDIDKELVALQEQLELLEQRKVLLLALGQDLAKKPDMTKAEIARQMYPLISGEDKKVIAKGFIESAGCTTFVWVTRCIQRGSARLMRSARSCGAIKTNAFASFLYFSSKSRLSAKSRKSRRATSFEQACELL